MYSGDAGASWHALASGLMTTTLTIDSSLLPGGPGQGLVRVIASDGLNSGIRQSASGFNTPNRRPMPFIYFPDDGGQYASGSSLTVRGAAYDPEEGYLPPDSLHWSLSGQGTLGSGEQLVLSDLADGAYTLMLFASSAGGQSNSRAVSFTIGGASEIYLPIILKP